MASSPLALRNLVSLRLFDHTPYVTPRSDKSTLQVILEGSKKLQELSIGINFPYPANQASWKGMVQIPVFPDCIIGPKWKGASYSSTIRNLKRLEVPLGEAVNLIYGENVPVLEFVIQGVAQIADVDIKEMWKITTSPWPIASSPVTTFSRVKSLHLTLDDLSLLTRVVLPTLEELCLTQSSESRRQAICGHTELLITPNTPIYFPKLHTLKVTHSHFSPLRWICAEQLDALHLTSTLLSRKEAEMDFSVLFSSIKSAKLHNTSPGRIPSTLLEISRLYINVNISEGVLTRSLESLPRLELLSFVPGNQLQRGFTREFTVDVEHDTVKANILCPVLQVLELDLHSFLDWDGMGMKAVQIGTATLEDFPSALKRMVSSRELGYTYPLERCTVIERDGATQEYVEFTCGY
ncbi:hypothetical protein M408DRAFT_24691 [Serendipita vermifera MAFF 305830]|uniref:F-box domain-containing protein n=1 Tax=Serendipita vermifera MAFF 305830 TaxID=933852 RepID=A0A0C3ARM7_SERVB|nr:hypothetical protein M408DRAFT_24691 [Serendipita vermifera MAFF 305830]